MEKFPHVAIGQFVLMRAELATGYILDESLNLVVGDDQKVFTVLNSYEEALSLAQSIVDANLGKVECIIYNENEEFLKYLNA